MIVPSVLPKMFRRVRLSRWRWGHRVPPQRGTPLGEHAPGVELGWTCPRASTLQSLGRQRRRMIRSPHSSSFRSGSGRLPERSRFDLTLRLTLAARLYGDPVTMGWRRAHRKDAALWSTSGPRDAVQALGARERRARRPSRRHRAGATSHLMPDSPSCGRRPRALSTLLRGLAPIGWLFTGEGKHPVKLCGVDADRC